MTLTNTNRVKQEVYWRMDEQEQVNEQVYEQVCEQLFWLMYDQIIPTQTKIEQEINK